MALRMHQKQSRNQKFPGGACRRTPLQRLRILHKGSSYAPVGKVGIEMEESLAYTAGLRRSASDFADVLTDLIKHTHAHMSADKVLIEMARNLADSLILL